MSDNSMQNQINEMNRKLDLVLEEINNQRLRREETTDLVKDLSIIGKDVFQASVTELDKAGVEVDGEELIRLVIRLTKNIGKLNAVVDTLESTFDLIQDVAPIVQQTGLDAIDKMHELEQKGYFAFVAELTKMMDKIVGHFSAEDLRALSDNVVTIMETVKSITQPEMLKAVNNAISVYQSLDMDNIPEYSLFRALREMRTPEMRKGLGFMVTFMKNIANQPK